MITICIWEDSQGCQLLKQIHRRHDIITINLWLIWMGNMNLYKLYISRKICTTVHGNIFMYKEKSRKFTCIPPISVIEYVGVTEFNEYVLLNNYQSAFFFHPTALKNRGFKSGSQGGNVTTFSFKIVCRLFKV